MAIIFKLVYLEIKITGFHYSLFKLESEPEVLSTEFFVNSTILDVKIFVTINIVKTRGSDHRC